MTAFRLAYRLTIMAPRSVDATETTPLSPIGGSHSDAFKVATITGVSGFQPYLHLPKGRSGTIDLLTKRLDQGTLTVDLQDQRTVSTSNFSRWVSNFIGDAKGRTALLGYKVLIEESTDGGSTWSDWWTGRVQSLKLASAVKITLTIRDMSRDLGYEVFAGRPEASLSYVVEPLVLPLGLSASYGLLSAAPVLGGEFQSSVGALSLRRIDLTTTSRQRADNVVTGALANGVATFAHPHGPLFTSQISTHGLRLRFSSASPSLTDVECEVAAIDASLLAGGGQYRVTSLYVNPVTSTSDPFYTDLDSTSIPDGSDITFTVRQVIAPLDTTRSAPLLLNDVHPVQLWADLLDGKFCRLAADGTVTRTFPYDSAAFATLIADTSFGVFRGTITDTAKLQDWVEANILQPYGLGMYLNGSGEVVPLDLRPPQSLPTSTTITDDDLADPLPQWEPSLDSAVSVFAVRSYVDVPITAADLAPLSGARGPFPDAPTTLLQSFTDDYVDASFGSGDLTEKRVTIDARGLRSMPGETYNGAGRRSANLSRSHEIAGFYAPTYSSGAMTVSLVCRRTANTNGVVAGTWRLIDVDRLPDPSTNLRGGTRLMRCVGWEPDGVHVTLKFVDAGPNSLAVAPTIATPTKETNNTQHGLAVTVTVNASSEAATLWVNATATTVGTRPGVTDPGWRQVIPVGQARPLITATGSKLARDLPGGKRLWVRTRTEPSASLRKLASAWAYPAGTGYVDLDPLSPPTSAAVAGITTKQATESWTVGEPTLPVMLRLANGANQGAADAATPTDYALLPAGMETFTLTGLDLYSGTWFHPAVLHVDGFGGESALEENGTVSFHATGSAGTAPKPGGLSVTLSAANSNFPTTPSGVAPYADGGIGLLLTPSPDGIGLRFRVKRGTSPGGETTIDEIDVVSSHAVPYFDRLAVDGTTYYYTISQVGDGVNESADSAEVSAAPGWFRKGFVFGGGTAPPVLGQTETITVPALLFQPDSDGQKFAYLGRKLNPNQFGGVTAFTGYAPLGHLLPVGVSVTAVRWRCYVSSASDSLQGGLSYGVDNVTTSVGTFSSGATTGDQTLTTSGLPHTVVATRSYFLSLVMHAQAAADDARLYYAEVDFVRNTYRQ